MTTTPPLLLPSLPPSQEPKEPQLDEHQQRVVEDAMREGLTILSGKPGSGKTTTMKAIVQGWLNQGERSVLVTSVSCAAVCRCIDVIDIDSKKILYMSTAMVFERRQLCRRLNFTCIVVDEAGMAPAWMLGLLTDVEFLKSHRVVLVGDEDQLKPVGAPACFWAIQQSDLDQLGAFYRLEKIYRQYDPDCALVKNIELVRHAENLTSDKLVSDDTFKCKLSDCSPADIRIIVRNVCWSAFRQRKEAPQFIALTHETCEIVNEVVQQCYVEHRNPHEFRDRDGIKWYPNNVGDKVMCTENFPRSRRKTLMPDVCNGQMGVVKLVEGRGLCIEYRVTRRKTYLDYGAKTDPELAYCITLHKAQGGEFERVVYIFSVGKQRNIDRRYLTVGLSRARKTMMLVTSDNDLRAATHTDTQSKSTLLQKMQEEVLEPDFLDATFESAFLEYASRKAEREHRGRSGGAAKEESSEDDSE